MRVGRAVKEGVLAGRLFGNKGVLKVEVTLRSSSRLRRPDSGSLRPVFSLPLGGSVSWGGRATGWKFSSLSESEDRKLSVGPLVMGDRAEQWGCTRDCGSLDCIHEGVAR